ncbi:cobalamin B12-binding domain-containing protein [Micromonospora sp. STR1_7]|uniref:Cobalamin B12-binding domain-containing protein n=1 Tax=Micromonospora parastrephiae TaxID=2806101 RepID=A0ABS1XR48_9ACTN|nr:cobalamin B12-binding domain-containing protein [Micromonospora parastrephiae]MBM0230756.1 cobalamin B12-binding domain-containing protein [Micromonospora parastrephiae]MBM0231734.1 cobalamin B12-binding domain-containing protein [Micromonospora parastrephiae]
MHRLNVVLTTTASDSHTWNLIYLELLLQEWGHAVTNLGPCMPPELLLRRCRELTPDLVVVSSVNGLGFGEARTLIPLLRDCPELAETPVVIGGKLGTGVEDEAAEAAELRAAGFDLVVNDSDGLGPFRDFVESMCLRVLR